MDIYREILLDHYKNPRNFGHLDHPDAVLEEGNVTCGDKINMELKIPACRPGRENGKLKIIQDIRFSGEGCAISQAAASMLTEKVIGMTFEDAMKLTSTDMTDMLGTSLTPSRMKCAVLSLEVLQKLILSLKK